MTKTEFHVGSKIRAYRKRKNMSLMELSQITGIAASNLSSIELDKSSPTLSTILKIAAAFHMKIGPFFDDVLYQKAVVCRDSRTGQPPDDQAGTGERVLTDGVTLNRMDARIIDVQPEGEAVPLGSPGTDRFVYCLQGDFAATVDEEVFDLSSGDSLYLLPEAVALIRVTGAQGASALVVNAPGARYSRF